MRLSRTQKTCSPDRKRRAQEVGAATPSAAPSARPRERQSAVSQSLTDVEKLKSGCPALRRRPGRRGDSPYLGRGLGPANSEPRPRRASRPSRCPAAGRRCQTFRATRRRGSGGPAGGRVPGTFQAKSAWVGPASALPSLALPSDTPPTAVPAPSLKGTGSREEPGLCSFSQSGACRFVRLKQKLR